MDVRIESVGQFAVGRRRPEAAHDENHTHRHRADHRGWEQLAIAGGDGDQQDDGGGDSLDGPWKSEQGPDAVDVRILERDVGGFADLGEERVVHDMNRPDEAHHEPGGDQMDDGEGGGESARHTLRVGEFKLRCPMVLSG